MSTDPKDFAFQISLSRVESLRFAIAGCLYIFRYQKNIRIILAMTLIIGMFALWLEIDKIEWAIIILTVGVVWVTEFINAAIEAVVNIIAPEYHPMASVSKDVAAGAVLVASCVSSIVGLLLLGPPLLHRLQLINSV